MSISFRIGLGAEFQIKANNLSVSKTVSMLLVKFPHLNCIIIIENFNRPQRILKKMHPLTNTNQPKNIAALFLNIALPPLHTKHKKTLSN